MDLYVKGSIPFPDNIGIAQWVEQQAVVGSNPTPTENRVTQMVDSYTFNVECEEVAAS